MGKGFFKGVKAELKKVVWPTKKQLISNTLMVITLALVFALVIVLFDMLLEFADGRIWDAIRNMIG